MEERYQRYYERIKAFIEPERIYTDDLRVLAWGTDAGFYRHLPQVVVRSKNEQEVSRLLRTAHEMGLPVTFRAAGTSLSGHALADLLREQFKLETEMSAADYVIAMTSVCDTDEGFDRLADALTAIDRGLTAAAKNDSFTEIKPEKAYRSCDCFRYAAAETPLQACAGKVSHEDVFAYPPGIPLIVKGEIISADMLGEIKRLEKCGVQIMSSRGTYPQGLIAAD